MITAGLWQHLTADTAVAALCGTRIYPLLLPTNPAPVFPCGTYQTISTVSQYTNDGPIGFLKSRIQIDSWADSPSGGYAAAQALAAAIAAALDGYIGTFPDGTEVLSIQLANQMDSYEEQAYLYRVQQDWLVFSAQ